MKRCKTCNWYKREDLPDTLKTCKCPKMVYGYRSRSADDDGMSIEDDEGWGMVPGPDFGCIHHEEAGLKIVEGLTDDALRLWCEDATPRHPIFLALMTLMTAGDRVTNPNWLQEELQNAKN